MVNILKKQWNWKRIGLLAVSTAVILVWLILTPPGLLGKADAIGYAVCHRIADRSFYFSERPMPLCARCTGMYLGAFIGLTALLPTKKSGLPRRSILFTLAVFVLFFAVDGLNSYLHFFPDAPWLYHPVNLLRLISGTGLGLGIAVILVPVFHQTIWKFPDPRAVLPGWKSFLFLIFLACLGDLAVLSGNPMLLYPIALMTVTAVMGVLTLSYALLWILILKHENRYTNLGQIWPYLLLGLLTALLQIGVFDIVRYTLTGTWNGFIL